MKYTLFFIASILFMSSCSYNPEELGGNLLENGKITAKVINSRYYFGKYLVEFEIDDSVWNRDIIDDIEFLEVWTNFGKNLRYWYNTQETFEIPDLDPRKGETLIYEFQFIFRDGRETGIFAEVKHQSNW